MSPNKISLLIADDEIYIQEILKSTLEEAGFDCVTVGSAEAAEAELAARSYSIVFCDVIMPGKSGIDLLQSIREKYPQMIVVMITAVDTASSAMETIRMGAYDYIVKPFNLELVTSVADRAMEKLRLEASNREYQAYLKQVADDRAAETRRLFYSMTQVLIGLLEFKEPFKAGYLKRIAEMSRYVARELKMTEDGVRKVYLAALLHDIGMMCVDDQLLAKRGALSVQEANHIREHASVAESVLKPILSDDEVLKNIRHHHERYDGTGYPDGLRGNIIPLGARIISVVAAFVAMQWPRPYRKALSPEEAIAELQRCAHTQFDHNVVTVFAALYNQVFRAMDPSNMRQL